MKMFFFKSLFRLLECKNFNSNGYFFNILAHETKTFKAPFKASDVHEQCGISFRTPPFPEQDINSQILVSCNKENILCASFVKIHICILRRPLKLFAKNTISFES